MKHNTNRIAGHSSAWIRLAALLLLATPIFTQAGEPAILENDACRIEFDGTSGELVKIENRKLGDNILKASSRPGIPFRVSSGFKKPWLPTANNEAAIRLGTDSVQLVSAKAKSEEAGKSLTLNYAGWGLEFVLKVVLPKDSGDSVWRLTVKNTGARAQDLLVEFPVLDGVQLGAPDAAMKQTWLNQAGLITDAWTFPERTYGQSTEWSMQWHSVFEPVSGSALGLVIKDPEALAKKLIEQKPVVKVSYFPPRALAVGESRTLPTTLLKVYRGDWKATARDFANWSEIAFKPAPVPQWVRELDSANGIHFKKAGPGIAADHGGQWLLDSFRDIPQANIRIPVDLTEYAFWCRGSMIYNKHTDGDNVIREDLGGAEAMREGIAAARKLGLRTCLYIEGYIVPLQSELAKEGKAQRWQVINADGGTVGPIDYTAQGFYMMCPGCVEWQDHLAGVATRVMKETGADGIRLDSLGYSYRDCYNPEHKHASPYDYNQWMKQLLSKVEKAVHSVKPDAMFWTEGPVDFYSRYCPTAYTQHKFYADDVPPMRIAMKSYRPFALTTAGVVWPSLAGLPGGRSQWEPDFADEEANWFCAQSPVHDTHVWGEVLENPAASDPEIRARHFSSAACDLLVAVRPEQQTSSWGDFGKLSAKRAAYDLSLPQSGIASPDMAVCDIEKLEWTSAKPERKDGRLVIPGISNWMFAVLPKPGHSVVGFDALPAAKPGDELEVKTCSIAGENPGAKLEVIAPGLTITKPPEMIAGQAFKVRVPESAFPGLYAVSIKGDHVMGIQRYLKVTK